MVFAATLLAFVYIFASTAVPAMATFYRNLGTGYWMTDFNITGATNFGNPIVGAPFADSNTAIQSWELQFFPHSGDKWALVTKRLEGTTVISAYAAVDAVELGTLKTERFNGTPLLLRHPDGHPEAYVFLPSFNPSLAITATAGDYQPLLLTKYDPSLPSQLWVPYTHLNAAVTGRPITPKDLRPATRDEVLAVTKEN